MDLVPVKMDLFLTPMILVKEVNPDLHSLLMAVAGLLHTNNSLQRNDLSQFLLIFSQRGFLMFNRRMFVALIAMFLFSAPAFAGSGGTKKDATITVRNDQATAIAVFVGTDAVSKAGALPANPTPSQIEAAGGVIVQPGKEALSKVVAGTVPVVAANLTGGVAQISVTIGKGQIKKYAFTPSNTLVAY